VSDKMTAEEVAIMIRARQLLRAKGFSLDADVTAICKAAGISRKTGYQWAEKHTIGAIEQKKHLESQLTQIKADHDKLQTDYDWISFENRGRKLAWEIHRVDELLALKKSTSTKKKNKKR
jgi:hypothetical protein